MATPTRRPTIRHAKLEDVPTILALIHELAHFEKSTEKVQATESDLSQTLIFDPSPSNPDPNPTNPDGVPRVARCLLLTLPSAGAAIPTPTAPAQPATTGSASASSAATDADRVAEANIAYDMRHRPPAGEDVAAFALYFHSYSTWVARPGVFLEDLFVRPAYRRAGFATMLLGRLADIANGGRLEWNCLRWNEGALRFYERIGGVRMDDWVGIRVDGERLGRLVEMGVAAEGGR
ncbi:MAG: hypothetical protein M1831_000342 [Alyxoria varia]|nr:MAG: hypothetical protein M1831_000342 [Alyxoria varia]